FEVLTEGRDLERRLHRVLTSGRKAIVVADRHWGDAAGGTSELARSLNARGYQAAAGVAEELAPRLEGLGDRRGASLNARAYERSLRWARVLVVGVGVERRRAGLRGSGEVSAGFTARLVADRLGLELFGRTAQDDSDIEAEVEFSAA
ncbi:MAG: hypothetical protein AAGI17_03280, partial [Planctomycetota bacterium]